MQKKSRLFLFSRKTQKMTKITPLGDPGHQDIERVHLLLAYQT